MGISDSNGNYYENEFHQVLEEAYGDQPVPSHAPTRITVTPKEYDTKLWPEEEPAYEGWKAMVAPRDLGEDYDFRGAFKAGIGPDAETGHWPDTFKKPNHPTFSNQSQYYDASPETAGAWAGEDFVPPDPFERAARRVKVGVSNEPNRSKMGEIADMLKDSTIQGASIGLQVLGPRLPAPVRALPTPRPVMPEPQFRSTPRDGGDIQRQGVSTLNRELRRSPSDGTFRTRAEFDDAWQQFTTPRNLPLSERSGFNNITHEPHQAFVDAARHRRETGSLGQTQPRQYYEGDTDIIRTSLLGRGEARAFSAREQAIRNVGEQHLEDAVHILNGYRNTTPAQREAIEQRIREATAERLLNSVQNYSVNRGTLKFESAEGKKGAVDYKYNPQTRDIYINWIGFDKEALGSGSRMVDVRDMGAKRIRELFNKIAEMFPEAKTITGYRVSGVRGSEGAGGGAARATMRIPGRSNQ